MLLQDLRILSKFSFFQLSLFMIFSAPDSQNPTNEQTRNLLGYEGVELVLMAWFAAICDFKFFFGVG